MVRPLSGVSKRSVHRTCPLIYARRDAFPPRRLRIREETPMATKTKTFKATIYREGSVCFIPVPFDPRPVFGKVRAPVKVTLNGFTYRSTIASMGDGPCIPLRKSNREAARLEGGETLVITLELDTDKREVRPPADLVRALKGAPPAWDRWRELSYSHQREYVEALETAKRPETRARRLATAVEAIAARGRAAPRS